MRLNRVGSPGWRDGNRALVAGFGIRCFLSKYRCVQDRSQYKQTDDSHGFILPPNVLESYLIPSGKNYVFSRPMSCVTLPLIRLMSTGFC